MRRAHFWCGQHDAGEIAFSFEPPMTLELDGERYVRARHGTRTFYAAVKGRGGRGKRFHEGHKRDFLAAFETGMTVSQAAETVGFSPGPVYYALRRDSSFETAYLAIKAARKSTDSRNLVAMTVRIPVARFSRLAEQARQLGLRTAHELVERTINGGADEVLELMHENPLSAQGPLRIQVDHHPN